MRNFIRSILHPAAYHGHGKKPPFFEGWYFKLVDARESHRYAVIPGIFLNDDPAKHHAFVQILDGSTGEATYHTYPADAFRAADGIFDVHIGPNRFSEAGLSLDIADDQRRIRGAVQFDGLSPWPVSWRSPGIMGWYAWVPLMECYHGVASLDHGLHGRLEIDGIAHDFDGGRGYIEKDWGQSFPSGYVWMQSNHFEQPGTCLTASIAVIPWLFTSFPGFIIGLWHGRQLYRFATYTGAKVESLAVTDETVAWVVRDRQYQLEMLATRAQGGLLYSPSRTDMHRRVNETMLSTIAVRLIKRNSDRPIFEGTGRNAGLEVHGDIDRLLGP